jgi:hypothetical protein
MQESQNRRPRVGRICLADDDAIVSDAIDLAVIECHKTDIVAPVHESRRQENLLLLRATNVPEIRSA